MIEAKQTTADWRASIAAVETAIPYFLTLQSESLRFLDSERAIEVPPSTARPRCFTEAGCFTAKT
jgi:hypothetical protein